MKKEEEATHIRTTEEERRQPPRQRYPVASMTVHKPSMSSQHVQGASGILETESGLHLINELLAVSFNCRKEPSVSKC
jgi:hypothetical protein